MTLRGRSDFRPIPRGQWPAVWPPEPRGRDWLRVELWMGPFLLGRVFYGQTQPDNSYS